MTFPNNPDVIEMLWMAGEAFGYRLSVQDQVVVARALADRRGGSPSLEDVRETFEGLGMRVPTRAHCQRIAVLMAGTAPAQPLLDVLVSYRQFAIRSLSGQFGGKTQGREEELRNNLLTYLPARGYTEARTGRGRTDILLPELNAVIEVKVWTGERLYEDGLVELGRYIHTEKPDHAAMVVFGDREPLPSIVQDHSQAVAETRSMEGLVVEVIVVPFEIESASKAAANTRRRGRDGR